MKKYLVLKSLVAALVLSGASYSLRADDPTPTEKSGDQKSEEAGKKQEEVKKLTPEERAAKRKEMRAKMEKHLAELRKKKADGTITAQQEKQLQRLEAMEKNGGKRNPNRNRAPKPPAEPPSTEQK